MVRESKRKRNRERVVRRKSVSEKKENEFE